MFIVQLILRTIKQQYSIKHYKECNIIFRKAFDKSLTTEIPMQLTLAFLWFDIWSWDYSILSIWWKAISKNTELNADIFAIELLKKYNINPLCAKQFFEADHNFADSAMEMLSSHPLNSTRIELLNTSANELWYTSINNCKTIKQ